MHLITPGVSSGGAFALFLVTPALRLSAAASAQADKPPAPTPAQVEFFEAKIRPVLMDTCGECHLDDEDGGLRVDSRERLVAGGENGPAIVPGDPEKSLLI